MKETPLFSILVANYNNGSYIKETIDSIFRQTYSNWEIIIVDDCSNDNSLELYKEWENHPQIKIFYNTSNQGVSYTKKRCIDEASGYICGFVDPDDAIVPEAIEIMVQQHIEHENAGLIYSEAYYCDENLKINKEDSIVRHRAIKESSYLNEIEYVIGHFATFKRNKYLETPKLNPEYKRATDQDLYYLLEEVSDLIYVNQFLYMYRIHKKGLSSVGNNTIKAFGWHAAVIIDTCRRRNIDFETILTEKMAYHMVHLNQLNTKNELDQIKRSYSFKIGRAIVKLLYPFRKLFQ